MKADRPRMEVADIARLVDLPPGVDRRTVIEALARQFRGLAAGLGENEVALFDVVFLEIARDCELSERAMLSEAIAPIANAPRELIAELAHDEAILVAGPVLRLSPRLDEETLLAIAGSYSQEHLAAIALRSRVSIPLTDVISLRGELPVVIKLVGNSGAEFSPVTARRIARSALDEPDLFIVVDKRPEFHLAVDQAHAAVDEEERVALLEGRQRPRPDPDARVAELTGDAQIDRALAVIAVAARTGHHVAARAFAQDTLESFIVIARAANLTWGTVAGLLLHRLGINASAHQINESRRRFDQLTRPDALHTTQIIAFKDKRLYAK